MRYAKYQNDWTADMNVWYARTIFREIFSWSRVLTGYPILQHILGGWWAAAMTVVTLLWRHYGRVGVSNHQPHDCLLNRSFRHRSKKTSKLRVTGLCAGNSPVTGEFPAQTASNAENFSIWWRHHDRFHISDDYWAPDKWWPRELRIWSTILECFMVDISNEFLIVN